MRRSRFLAGVWASRSVMTVRRLISVRGLQQPRIRLLEISAFGDVLPTLPYRTNGAGCLQAHQNRRNRVLLQLDAIEITHPTDDGWTINHLGRKAADSRSNHLPRRHAFRQVWLNVRGGLRRLVG